MASFEKLFILQQKSTSLHGDSRMELSSHRPFRQDKQDLIAHQPLPLPTVTPKYIQSSPWPHKHSYLPHSISKKKDGKDAELEVLSRFGSSSWWSWECCKTHHYWRQSLKEKISTFTVKVWKLIFQEYKWLEKNRMCLMELCNVNCKIF